MFTSVKKVMFSVWFVCLTISRMTKKTYQTNFHENWWQGLAWTNEQSIKFLSRSESQADSQI